VWIYTEPKSEGVGGGACGERNDFLLVGGGKFLPYHLFRLATVKIHSRGFGLGWWSGGLGVMRLRE